MKKKAMKETPKRVAPNKSAPKMPKISGSSPKSGSSSSGVIPSSFLKKNRISLDLSESIGSPRQGSRPQMQGPGGSDSLNKAKKK